MVSILLLIYNSSTPFSRLKSTVKSAPTTFGINLISLYQFFSLSFNFLLFHFVVKMSKAADDVFWLINTTSSYLTDRSWSVWISKSKRNLRVSCSWTHSAACLEQLLIRSKFNLLHDSKWFTSPTKSCLVLHTFFLLFFAFFYFNFVISWNGKNPQEDKLFSSC